MTRPTPIALLLAAVLAAVAPRAIAAQGVRGTVVHADSATPAPGIIVQLLDSSGVVVARTLSGPRGDFALRTARRGAHRLRALRIGFRPTLGPVLALGDTVADVRLVLTGAAVALPAIAVRERSPCRTRPDSGELVARVWDEARKALTAAILTAEARRFDVTLLRYERTLDSLARVTEGLRVTTGRTLTTRPFASIGADSLRRVGYLEIGRFERTYFAPDAEVLLSDAFAADHCMQIAGGDSATIALAFEPVTDRRSRDGARTDIAGVLRIDRRSAELREIEYRYVGLPEPEGEAIAGGHVEFLRVEEGAWFVSRWRIRMPLLEEAVRRELVDRTPAGIRSGRMTSRRVIRVANVHDEGGEITRIALDGRALFERTGRTLEGSVTDGDAGRPVPGARVTLAGTTYRATADSAGRFAIADVLAAEYRVLATTPLLDSIGARPRERTADLRAADQRGLSVALPRMRDALAGLCDGRPPRDSSAVLVVVVRDSATGITLQGIPVTLAYQDSISFPGGESIMWRDKRADGRSDARGRVAYCGLARDRSYRVQVAGDHAVIESRLRVPAVGRIVVFHGVVLPR
jgi:hypothetical protein